MQRNPYGISSIGSLVIMVVLLSGVIGVSIPLMSGGLPRRQGDAQNSATPAHSETFASQAGTPAVLVEAAGRSDGTVGRSSKSTPVVSTRIPQRSFDTHGHIDGPNAAAESAGAFCGFPPFCRFAAGRDTIPHTLCRSANSDCLLDCSCCAVDAICRSYQYVLTRCNRHFSTCGTCYVACPTHTEPTPPADLGTPAHGHAG